MEANMDFSSLTILLVISGAVTASIVVAAVVYVLNGKLKGSSDVSKSLADNRDELNRLITNNQLQIENKFELLRHSFETTGKGQRDEAAAARTELQKTLNESLEKMSLALKDLTEANARKQAELQAAMQDSIDKMQKSNEEKLEKMRETVDEKLQGTLEKRLGESFKLVSDQLESVQKGLGEMQTLASGVGDLKRVLTNVKNRGGWGEVQLASQLEDMLSPEQYEANVKIKANSDALVEFAVKLPGRQEGEVVYLPIDSKFPQEDYERLLGAQETGDKDAIEAASKDLERAIKAQAKIISEKYIDVPRSTDFAIMYLPTEGLFAEVIRRPGLASELQNKFRVQITGPTTLMSLLNSLQMGFKTLAIEKSTSDVWKVLSAAKAEFQKYGQVWDKLQKQLNTAQNTVSAAKTRTNAIERTLKNVETGAGIESTPEFQAIESMAAEIEVEDATDENDEEQV
jgi:DNA recombination protein RmuC